MSTATEVTPDQGPVNAGMAQLGGKYMTFKLAEEEYGLEILKVREIIGFMEVTRVPRTPEFIRGVINLRGKVIPVIDLRLKFAMPRTEATDQTVIIVVQCQLGDKQLTMGILVDQVLEVLSIDGPQIEPPPSFGTSAVDTEFILGVGKAEKRVIFLLDIDKVLSTEEAKAVAQAQVA
ncbi:chemotaxis protein CheW [Anaeromyxobacter paludicola]|uniref:Chemotaxis protein CheW n=1 Tax=Anaeromyxobacter paludicola TaxID=2918171 RepID=A0ABN6N7L9_9BACT|nr:chemotaxis protein CheW [Anaeromyxobacter paludicola]BDG07980.1 chemotaxis protein CheW [Anaeromyxobacter paludicola]